MKVAWFLKLLADLMSLTPSPAVRMPDLADVAAQARREKLAAQNYFNAIADADLIDYTIYLMQAAEKKYSYLLKLARREAGPPIAAGENNLSHDRTAKVDYNKE